MAFPVLNTIHGNFHSIMRFVKRNLYPCSEITKRLAYTTIVGPNLEYASAVWNPYK